MPKIRIDPSVVGIIGAIKVRQDAYFATHGFYFQGLRTPIEKCDGSLEKEINLSVRPSDQVEDWATFGLRAGKLPIQIWVDVCKYPTGECGWQFFAEYSIGGKVRRYLDGEWQDWQEPGAEEM